MNAANLVLQHGNSLVGRMVLTQAMGAYPGGPAKVIQIKPDRRAPEIVMQVEHPTWKNDSGGSDIGVFEYEDCELLPEKPGRKGSKG